MLHIRHHAQVSVPISLETLRVDGEEGVESVSVPFSAESHQGGVIRDGGYVWGAVCKTWPVRLWGRNVGILDNFEKT